MQSARVPLLRNGEHEEELADVVEQHEEPTETTALVPTKKKSNPVVIKTVTSGIGNLMVAVNLTANSLLFINEGYSGIGSLTTSFQSLLLGISGGALGSVGIALGKPLGEKDFIKASQIAKTSYVLTAGLSLFSMAAYASTYFIFPKLFSESTADAASTYFLIAMANAWPGLSLVTTGQLAFQSGDWLAPLLSVIAFRIPAIPLSYLFGNVLKMGPEGIGIGNTISPWVSYVCMQLWLTRKEFQYLNQAPLTLSVLKENLKSLGLLGARVATQRLTEWGNLAAITSVLGGKNDDNLTIINPSLQIMTLLNLFSQGIGMGGNMILSVQRSQAKQLARTALETKSLTDLGHAYEAHRQMKSTILKTIGSGVAINGALAVVLFLAREPIIDLFLGDNATPEMKEMAETTLWINGLGLVADALRIISGTLLNTWDKIIFQNFIAIAVMTAIGVPLGKYAGDELDSPIISMFSIRTGMLLISALVNAIELFRSFKADEKELAETDRLIHDESGFSVNDVGNPFTVQYFAPDSGSKAHDHDAEAK